MSLTVKAYFKNEIRRIPLEVSNASSFALLEEKIRATFFDLPARGRLAMRWKDSEGDLVMFGTDDELIEALGTVQDGVFKVYLENLDDIENNRNDKMNNKNVHDFVQNLLGTLAEVGAAFDMNDHCGFMKNRTNPCNRSGVSAENPSEVNLTKEELEKLNLISGTVCDAVKMKLADICNSTEKLEKVAECTEVALKSGIQRAIAIQRKTGAQFEIAKKVPKKFKKESSSSSSENDFDFNSEDEVSIVKTDKKRGLNKKIKTAAKEVELLTFKEVNESFGKLAAQWASKAVAETMRESVKKIVKSDEPSPKKSSKFDDFESSGMNDEKMIHSDDQKPPACNSGTDQQSAFGSGFGSGNGYQKWGFPNVGQTTQTSLNDIGNLLVGLGASAVPDEAAIQSAVDAFKRMGFQPDEKLMEEIRKAQGDIAKVFENMKK